MDLLVLGGTGFLGRVVATQARDRGFNLTCLARGTRPPVDGVTLVRADRQNDDALQAVGERTWDAVIDLTSTPGHARRAVRDLHAGHWVFVSTANVYTQADRPEQDEGSPVHEPMTGDTMDDMSLYGPAKVACEVAIRAGTESHTIVRAGLIGGDGDTSARSGYYPWRFAHPTGTDVLVPPDLAFPVAMIDAQDLAAWILDCVQERIHGTFNATGATTTLGEVLEASCAVARSEAVVRPVPADVLAEAGIAPWMGPASLPLWIDDPSLRWFSTLETTAARNNGLRTRPLRETLGAALAYEESREQPRPCGLTDDEERALRARLERRPQGRWSQP